MSRKIQVVLVLLSVAGLVAFAWWDYRTVYRMRETILRTNLHTLRDVIVQFHGDKGRAPRNLEELVRAGYLRQVPTDPFTGREDTWITLTETDPGWDGAAGVVEVRSGSGRASLAGEPLSRW